MLSAREVEKSSGEMIAMVNFVVESNISGLPKGTLDKGITRESRTVHKLLSINISILKMYRIHFWSRMLE